MNTFLTRIELHHHDEPEDYKNLHDLMYSNKFYRVIKTQDNKWRDLPSAEYLTETEKELDYVYNLVEIIVSKILKVSPLQKNTKKEKHFAALVTQVFSKQDGSFYMKLKLDPTTDKKKLPPGETL